MSILFIEIRKLKNSKVFLFAIIFSFLVNYWLLVMSAENEEFKPYEYKAVFSEIKNMNNQEKLKWLDENCESNMESQIYDMGLLYTLREECQEKNNYNMFLHNIEDQAFSMTTVSLFLEKNSFNYRNIIKTANAYTNIGDINPKFDISKGILHATSNRFTDVFSIIIIMLTIASVIRSEEEYSMASLLFSTPNGHKYLISVKMFLIACVSFLMTSVLYTENFLVCNHIYGLGDLERPVQSLDGFTGCNIKINVFWYMIIYVAFKSLVIYIIGAGLTLLSVKIRNTIEFYSTTALFIIGQLLMYTYINPFSVYALFKNINLFKYLSFNEIFKNYNNINILGYPVNYLKFSVTIIILGIILISLIAYKFFSFERYNSNNVNSKINLLKKNNTRISIKNKLWYAFYKSLLLQKGFFYTIVFFVMVISFICSFEKNNDFTDVYYKKYTTLIEGKVTSETINYLNEEEKRFNDIHSQIEKINDGETSFENSSSELNELYIKLRPYDTFVYVKERAEKIYNIDNTKIFYDVGYRRLFGIENYYDDDIKFIIITMMYCSLIISPLFAFDNTNNINLLIYSTCSGRRSFIKRNKFIARIYALLAVSIWNLIYICLIAIKYDLPEINTSLKSIKEYSDIKFDITIFQYVLIIVLLRIIFALICADIMSFISSKIKSIVIATIVNLSIFVVPSVVYILGYKFMIDIGVNPLLSVTRIINKYFFFLS